MSRAILLRLAATTATVLAVLSSAGYVATHAKNSAAPLQPPVPKSSPTPFPIASGRIQIPPAVRATELPGVVNTHVS
jgi:hypothetical protein